MAEDSLVLDTCRPRTLEVSGEPFLLFRPGGPVWQWFLSPYPYPGLQAAPTLLVVVVVGPVVVVVGVVVVVVGTVGVVVGLVVVVVGMVEVLVGMGGVVSGAVAGVVGVMGVAVSK